MRYKGSMIMIMLAIFLFAVAAVGASDANDTAIASTDETPLELSENDETLLTEEIQTEGGEIIGETDEGTFAALDNKINTGTDPIIKLENNYTYEGTGYSNGIAIYRDDITIDGQGHTIDAKGQTRIFKVTGENVVLKNIIFLNGKTSDNGGAVNFYSNGAVTNCTFTNNQAQELGGAILLTSGTVTNCTFTNNQGSSGGAIYLNSGTVTNCTFTNNQAQMNGGAIDIEKDGEVTNCTFTNNQAQMNGGAIYINNNNCIVTNCTFTNNQANEMGGAIYHINYNSESTMTNCNFTNNTAPDGGAIYCFKNIAADTCIFKTPSDTTNKVTVLPPTLNVDNFTTLYNSGEKITFDLKTNSSMPVYNGNISISVYKKNGDWVGNYSCMSGDGWTVPLSPGEYYAIYNTEYAAFTPINRTITVTVPNNTFWALNNIINGNGDSVINLTNDFYFDPTYDADFVEGIRISRSVTINGNGKTIDAKEKARIFRVNNYFAVLENIIFANGTTQGGSAIILTSGTVKNCIFTNNHGTYGGAIRINSYNGPTVTDCIFTNNIATMGGAILIEGTATVKNCNFTNNEAYYGGALYYSASDSTNTVTDCSFTNNQAYAIGGALWMISGTARNCNFTNNKAPQGGAVRFSGGATVENCNFTGNNASTGSAIWFFYDSSIKTVSNSIFLNNRADADSLQATINESNVEILFIGKNNIINAINSDSDVNFTNVTYWGAEGITTVSGIMNRSDREAGQNITVTGVVNGNIINETYITDGEGKIVLKDISGDYWICIRHNEDTYYTGYETIATNMGLYINITSMTTNNRTVNLTAASNIYNEVMPGQLMFILPNGGNITANYGANGTWWAVHTFDNYTVYNIDASYEGLDNVKISNAIINVSKADSTLTVNDIAFDYKATGSSDISFTYASGVTAKVIDHPEAAVNVKDNKITVSGLDAGTYTLSVTTLPDADHNAVTKTVKVTVRKLKTTLTAKAVTATYKVNKNLVITLKDAKGNPIKGVKVTVKIKSTKTLQTDSKGQIKVSTKGLTPKKYTAKITFSGNENYLKSTKSVKVTVKKAKPKITAKKKTYKTTTKTKKYTVTLKDNKGKAIKKAKLTLKVKGKTYKAKTNKKGKVTFKVTKLTKKGTYKATVTYKGNKYYKKVSKKSKIKVIVTFKTVSKGSKDKNTVKEVQQALKDHGYYTTYKGHYLKVDGKYGKYTVKSIKQFQSDKKLKVTGKVDEKTAKKLKILQ